MSAIQAGGTARATGRRLRYSLRALFALVSIAAFAAVSFRIQLDRLAAEHDSIAKLQSAGASVATVACEPRWFWDEVPKSLAPHTERAVRFEASDRQGPIGSHEMTLVARLSHLKDITLGNLPLEDKDLAPCAALTELECLNFTNCRRLTSKAIDHFRSARRLRYIDFGATPIDDAALETMATFDQLEDLRLTFTNVTDAGMRHLIRLKGLKRLNLPRGVSIQGLREIEHLDSLTDLCIYLHSGEDMDALQLICQFPRLRSLEICGHMTDAGLATIANARGLKRLWIRCEGFTDEALAAVEEAAQSRSLDLTAIRFWNEEEDDLVYAHGLPTRVAPAPVPPRRVQP